MKVIDLLNKIANGEEVPKKIQVYSDIFVFDDSNGVYEHEETRTNLLSIYNGNILNYEVRIKAEDKKIKTIDCWYSMKDIKNNPELYNIMFVELKDKINEIIDKLKKMIVVENE